MLIVKAREIKIIQMMSQIIEVITLKVMQITIRVSVILRVCQIFKRVVVVKEIIRLNQIRPYSTYRAEVCLFLAKILE